MYPKIVSYKFLPDKFEIRNVSSERLTPVLIPLFFATFLNFKNSPKFKCPNVNIWPSYKFYSSLVSLYYHHLISNLINLFCGLFLLFSTLFKSHFRVSNAKTFRLSKNHTVHPYHTQFSLFANTLCSPAIHVIFFHYLLLIYIEHLWLLICLCICIWSFQFSSSNF